MHGIRRAAQGYDVALASHERELLRSLCLELAGELQAPDDSDPALGRLFPRAFRDDDAASDEYDRLVRPSLESGKLAALRAVADSADATTLDEDGAQTWLRALNDLRLVLGVRLDVREDDSLLRLREPQYRTYAWLTWLQSEVLDACSTM